MDDNRLERIEVKLDDIVEHLSSIDVTLAEQHLSLKEHIRRTALLEQDLSPIKVHVNRVEGITKFVVIMMGAVAAVSAIIELLLKK